MSDDTRSIWMYVRVGCGGCALLIGVMVISYFGLWLQAYLAGARISLFQIIAMRFRKVNPAVIVRCRIMGVQADIPLDTKPLEAHYLAGGFDTAARGKDLPRQTDPSAAITTSCGEESPAAVATDLPLSRTTILIITVEPELCSLMPVFRGGKLQYWITPFLTISQPVLTSAQPPMPIS